ncbi:hypothetical protein [Luteimonas huabeiensis]|uniref:hypothetical protein n=1 Tax=Luteimonas huabeiensis TaxID=1244513 RepID=UPI001268BB0B|nr:hypothetical protein [Luteimonas huabeiensis]
MSGIAYKGPEQISYTSPAEAEQGLGADGQAAPEGATAVPVGDGEYISLIMARHGLDWTNPDDRVQFLQDNPQFITDRDLAEFPDELGPYAGQAGGRDPDLVYEGEVIYVRIGEDAPPGDGGQADRADGQPTQAEAAESTDAAAQAVQDAKDAEYPPGMQSEQDAAVQQANQTFFEAMQTEIEAGLQEFLAANPDATPQQIQAEADRLKHQIQGRTEVAAGMDDYSMDFRTQQAVNAATAGQHGVDLDDYAPGAVSNDGPYTETSGPFESDSSVQLANGTYVRTDENGWPETDADGDGVADPATPEAAAEATNQAAEDLQNARNMDVPPGLQHEKEATISHLTTQAGDAVQQEIEIGLQAYVAANPDATEQEIADAADRLMHEILGREEVGGVISESQAEFRRDAAVEFVTTGD